MHIIVYTTTPTKKEAEKIAGILIKEKLAACVNHFPVTSTYTWNKKTQKEREYLLSCKTLKTKFPKLKKRIKQLHSYSLPAITYVKISGDSQYLDWIKQEVA